MQRFSSANVALLAGRICPAWHSRHQVGATESAGGFGGKPTNTELERNHRVLPPVCWLASQNWNRICV